MDLTKDFWKSLYESDRNFTLSMHRGVNYLLAELLHKLEKTQREESQGFYQRGIANLFEDNKKGD